MIALTTALLLTLSVSQDQGCGLFVGSCPQGCWLASGIVFSDGSRMCVPVGEGYYSPRNNDLRYKCNSGTFSNFPTAEVCTSCPAGTYSSSQGSVSCSVCPAGTYSGRPQSQYCSLCDPTYYSNEGANSAEAFGGKFYCILLTSAPTPLQSSLPSISPSISPSMPPSMDPSAIPISSAVFTRSATPSAQPSSHSTVEPSSEPPIGKVQVPSGNASHYLRTFEPSLKPSAAPSIYPSTQPPRASDLASANVSNTIHCEGDFFFQRGACVKCPSTRMAILLSFAFLVFVCGIIAFLLRASGCCLAKFFIGVEYLQILFLLGRTDVPWPQALDRVFAFLGIFAVDLNAIIPFHCYLRFSPYLENVFILVIPTFLVFLARFIIDRRQPTIADTGTSKESQTRMQRVYDILAFALFLGYANLLLTSFDAISCSAFQKGEFSMERVDWFCLSNGNAKEKFAAMIGLAGFLAYGLTYPVWFFRNILRVRNAEVTKSSASHELHLWTRYFLQPFHPSSWWWTAFLLGRKFALAAAVFFLQGAPLLTLTSFIILIMLSEIAQRSCPIYHDNFRGDKQDSSTAFGYCRCFLPSTLDISLQVCLIYTSAFGLIFLGLSENIKARPGLTVLVLLVLLPSFLYLALSFCFCSCHECICKMSESKNTEATLSCADLSESMSYSKYGDIHKRIFRSFVQSEEATNETMEEPNDIPSDFLVEPRHDLSNERKDDEPIDDVHGSQYPEIDQEDWLESVDKDIIEEWHQTEDYETWLATGESVVLSSLRAEYEEKIRMQYQEQVICTNQDQEHCIGDDCESNCEDRTQGVKWDIEGLAYSDDGSNHHIFADEETIPSESKSWDEESEEGEEIWIDEATGLPVDPAYGAWTDVETGTCVRLGQCSHSDKDEFSDPHIAPVAQKKDSLILEGWHRVEPSTWGRRQSSVYQPSS